MEKIIIIVGPTGVGKTKLSIQLAKKYDSEIISGDSMQVYKEMNIGTAKIKQEEMQGVIHHMIDFCSYRDEFNVKIFQYEARACIEKITRKKKLPIICGGTGLYIKSLYYDYDFQDEQVDEDFQAFLRERSDEECYRMLQVVDQASANKTHEHNRKRVERALMRAHVGEKKSVVEEKQQHLPIYDAYVIGLNTSRDVVYERINQRVENMIKEGLEDEVKALVHQKEDWQLQSLQGIGYKEWKDYFDQKATIDETIEKIKKNSRNFAKRQFTWFNNQMKVNWYDINKDEDIEKLEYDLDNWLNVIN